MKVLSKYLKVALCFVAFALCSFMFAFTPTLTAVQAATLTGVSYEKALSALKMPTENVDYSKDEEDEFKIPLLSSVVGAETSYTIRVVDPAGYNHDYVIGGTKNDANYFTLDDVNDILTVNARNNGEYKVIYIVNSGNRQYYSNSYTVNVTNVSYELDFSTPVLKTGTDTVVGYTKNLIKTKMAVSTEAYELPVAYAKITGKDLTIKSGAVTNEKATIKVTKDGAPQDVLTSDFFSKNGDKYFITPSKAGVYTVEYSFENSENRPTKTYTINVADNFTASELKLASTPTMPTIELGKSITLPKLTVNAGEEKNVDVNVTSIKIEKENSNGAIVCELTNNNFNFEMSPASFTGVEKFADMLGNYNITYTVKDANNKTLTETFRVDGVTVSSKPSIKLSYNYDTADLTDVKLGAETELKAEYEISSGFVLPAVYVEDAVTPNYSDFTIIRTIRKGSTYYYVDNKKYDEETGKLVDVASTDKGYNASKDANIGKTNKAVTFKFNSNAQNVEGTYYLEFRVITNQVKQRESYLYVDGTSTKYSFKVVADSSHEETTPTVEITNLKDRLVKNTEDITVKVTSTDTLDTRLKNVVFTYTGTTANFTGTDTFASVLQKEVDNLLNAIKTEKELHVLDDARLINGWSITTKDEHGADVTLTSNGLKHYFENIKLVAENETKNSFDLDLSSQTSGDVNVVAVAINDDGNVATDIKTLTIKDTTNDDEKPEMNIYVEHLKDITTTWTDSKWLDGSDNIQEFEVGQGVEIKLPTVYVEDVKDKSLMLNVMYYINSPENAYGGVKYLSPANKRFYYESELFANEVQAIDGGTITTTETGVYYVAYTATDVAGNTNVMYFTFTVKDTSKPILSVEPVSDDEITISGNTITAGKGTIIDFESTLKSSDGKEDYTSNKNITVTINDDGKGLDFQPSGDSRTSYVFNSYGTYTVTISGEYETTVGGDDVTLVADNKVVKVVIEKQAIEWLGEFDVTQQATTNQEVKLPDIAASNGAVVSVKYMLPGDSEDEAVEAKKVTDASGYTYWSFTTNESSTGTYKVIYTAKTDEDVLTKTISIKVGDNVPPTISVGNRAKVEKQLVYDGENEIEYLVELNRTKSSTQNRYFKITVTNNGKEIYSEDINLSISDVDDNDSPISISWSSLTYELTGPSVTTGESTNNKTQYLIKGTGEYVLTLKVKDGHDNEGTQTIKFKVVTESSVEEKNDTVVGAVLIVISLILLAGVILFFTLTGKKGGNNKSKKEKVVKTKQEEKVEVENEVKAVEETAEQVEETANEEVSDDVKEDDATEVVEETSENEEPKTGDVE